MSTVVVNFGKLLWAVQMEVRARYHRWAYERHKAALGKLKAKAEKAILRMEAA